LQLSVRLMSEVCFLVFLVRPLWQEVGSDIWQSKCVVICQSTIYIYIYIYIVCVTHISDMHI
jgi:hypothetical protein